MKDGEILNLPVPDDWHVHLRQGEMLDKVVGYTSDTFGRALIMPNLTPAILTGAQALAYRKDIVDSCQDHFFNPDDHQNH